MFSCRCLNVSISINDESVLEKLKTDANRPANITPDAAIRCQLESLFQGKPIGPVPTESAEVHVQLKTLLKVSPLEGWEVAECLNCRCRVYAHDALSKPATFLFDAALGTTAEAVADMRNMQYYSPVYQVILLPRWDGGYRNYYPRDQCRDIFNGVANTVDSLNDQNELLEKFRAFMLAETQAANERIERFTREQNELISGVRDRAEQDFIFLVDNFVPELMYQPNASAGRRIGEGGAMMSHQQQQQSEQVASAGTGTTPSAATGGAAGSQMETPPPTPECMPMSTGNSPPSLVAATGCEEDGSAANRTSATASSRVLREKSSVVNRTSLLSGSAANTINNNSVNTNLPTSNNQGAINSQSSTPTQPPQQKQQLHSSSTNLFANQQQQTAPAAVPVVSSGGGLTMTSTLTKNTKGSITRLGGHTAHQQQQQHQQTNSSPDTDCLFDIDGIESDKTPPPDNYSDEDECDYDNATMNNNMEGSGMHIPSFPSYGRQFSAMSRSVPISTPRKMTLFPVDDDDIDEMTEDSADIAANIKALARSVHGDAVFGDLPRPQVQRFTSQI
uniref:Putative serine/threonine-protein kinase ndrc n=1 Tax=Anopheles darlingi TaxID=43151 RepID=A0A2M4CRG3_ANODA